MSSFPKSVQELIDVLGQLPGIGPKTAERLALFLIRQPKAFVERFLRAVEQASRGFLLCSTCGNIAESSPCAICRDRQRDGTTVCVVAEPQDVAVIERSAEYRGRYHVLGGVLNPIEGVTPDQLRINELVGRIKHDGIKEVILATNPDLEGESTALYLARHLKPLGVKVTRLARGLPVGADIEYADDVTIQSAIRGRQEV